MKKTPHYRTTLAQTVAIMALGTVIRGNKLYSEDGTFVCNVRPRIVRNLRSKNLVVRTGRKENTEYRLAA